jgi:hypothetical protein
MQQAGTHEIAKKRACARQRLVFTMSALDEQKYSKPYSKTG